MALNMKFLTYVVYNDYAEAFSLVCCGKLLTKVWELSGCWLFIEVMRGY